MKKIAIIYGPMLLMGLILMVINHRSSDKEAVNKGWEETVKMSIAWTPLILVMFFLTGQANALIRRNMDDVKTAISGGKGMIGATIAGAITPGSMTSAPIIRELWDHPEARGTLILYFLASNLINIQLILIRAPMLGKEATIGLTWVGIITVVVSGIIMFLLAKIH
jgi:uncharacterized membrane protein YraQ (UPF0718 family)